MSDVIARFSFNCLSFRCRAPLGTPAPKLVRSAGVRGELLHPCQRSPRPRRRPPDRSPDVAARADRRRRAGPPRGDRRRVRRRHARPAEPVLPGARRARGRAHAGRRRAARHAGARPGVAVRVRGVPARGARPARVRHREPHGARAVVDVRPRPPDDRAAARLGRRQPLGDRAHVRRALLAAPRLRRGGVRAAVPRAARARRLGPAVPSTDPLRTNEGFARRSSISARWRASSATAARPPSARWA